MIDPLIGSELGRYRITREIGAGGMGRVYEATQAESGALVAIKVIAERYGRDASLIERFFAEARAANLIAHESIVKVHDLALLADGRPYIVMERLAGTTLRTLLHEDPPPLGGILHVMLEVLSALAAAHAAGIVHRDLKPDNIFVTERGRAKVLDFGIAKLTGANAIARTQTGVVLGTPEYMAPEHISDGTADARSDVYAAGVVLFEALTGRRPFTGASDFELMRAHVSTPPPRVRSLRPELPEALDALIDRALAKRPADRFSSATSMANALRQVAAKISIEEWRPIVPGGRLMSPRPPSDLTVLEPSRPATKVTVAERPRVRAAPRRRSWFVLAGALAIAGIAGAVIATHAASEEPAAVPRPVFAESVPVLAVKASLSANEVAPRVEPVVEPSKRDTPAPARTPSTPSVGSMLDFDWQGYVVVAEQIAIGRATDARLAGITLTAIAPDGKLDLMAGGAVTYRFNARSKPSASCEIEVTVSKVGASFNEKEDSFCATVVPRPRCTSRQVRERARLLQPAMAGGAAKLAYGPSGWEVSVGAGVEAVMIDDRCKVGESSPRTSTTVERDAKVDDLLARSTALVREHASDAKLVGIVVEWRGGPWTLRTSYSTKNGCLVVTTDRDRQTVTDRKGCIESPYPVMRLPACRPEQLAKKAAAKLENGTGVFVWTDRGWQLQGSSATIEDDC